MFNNNIQTSSVFGAGSVKMEAALKNPNQFREAVAIEIISGLPKSKIREFATSTEAKTMVESGIISQDAIDMLVDSQKNRISMAAVCQMAKEAEDPDWDELVRLRIEERRILNNLVAKYGSKADEIASNIQKDINKTIPKFTLSFIFAS